MDDFRQLAAAILLGLTCTLFAPTVGLIIATTFVLDGSDDGVDSEIRCRGPDVRPCLERADGLDSIAKDSCEGEGKHICIAPLGSISETLVRRLVDYYDDTYDLEIGVLTPSSLPERFIDPYRQQIEAKDVASLISQGVPLYPGDRDTVVIGLMPIDLYIEEMNWRYAFGRRWTDVVSLGVISTVRMNPETFGEPADDDLYYDRVRKMLSKYIGLMYYELPLSQDPTSPMYDNILSVADLDRMGDDLPIE